MRMDPFPASMRDSLLSTASIAVPRCAKEPDPRRVRPTVIAYRKACRPEGTGLSHYVLVAGAVPRGDEPRTTQRP